MNLNYVVQRPSGIYSFRMVVPERHRAKFGKKEVWHSLETRDKRLAIERAGVKVGYYSALFFSDTVPDDRPLSIQDAKSIANTLGFTYASSEQLTTLPFKDSIRELCARLNTLQEIAKPDRAEIAVMAGAVEPTLSLDSLLERYQELTAGRYSDLSERERQKKWNPFPAAIREFKKEIGDIDVLKITTTHTADFAAKLDKRIAKARETGGRFGYESGRKIIMRLRMMIERVFSADFPCESNPFEKTKLESQKDEETRTPFTEAEIRQINTMFEQSDANGELKAIAAVLENTGARPKEICLLAPADINLDSKIPHIIIRANENRKKLKTKNSTRIVPLVGAALKAFQKFPNGFPRYRRDNGSEAFSAALNKLIRKIGIEDRTGYCYRHRFIDLMRDSGSPDSRTMTIVGHMSDYKKTQTDDYGNGASLQIKQKAMLKALEFAPIRAQHQQEQI